MFLGFGVSGVWGVGRLGFLGLLGLLGLGFRLFLCLNWNCLLGFWGFGFVGFVFELELLIGLLGFRAL